MNGGSPLRFLFTHNTTEGHRQRRYAPATPPRFPRCPLGRRLGCDRARSVPLTLHVRSCVWGSLNHRGPLLTPRSNQKHFHSLRYALVPSFLTAISLVSPPTAYSFRRHHPTHTLSLLPRRSPRIGTSLPRFHSHHFAGAIRSRVYYTLAACNCFD